MGLKLGLNLNNLKGLVYYQLYNLQISITGNEKILINVSHGSNAKCSSLIN